MATQRSTKPVPIDPDQRFDYDLDVLIVEEEDAPPFSFKWGGERFEMPLMMALPFADQLELEELTTEESMRQIMGDDDFTRLLTTKGGPKGEPPSTGRMKALIEAWHRHQGLEPGESQPSPRSYGSTAGRSKPTSRSPRARRTR